MKKRKCKRFTIPGTILYYKKKRIFFSDKRYSEDCFPVLDLSKGGASFLNNERLKPGIDLMVRIIFPEPMGFDNSPLKIFATTRWTSKNNEESYRFQTGISFYSYGNKKTQNSPELLRFFNKLECRYITNLCK